MICRDFREQLLDEARGTLSESTQHALTEHVAGCAGCAAEREHVQRAWSALDEMPAQQVPVHLRATVLATIDARRPAGIARRVPRIASVLGGIAAAVTTVTLLVAQDPDCRSPVSIACCGVLWVVAYALAFALLRRNPSKDGTRALVGRGLVAAGGGFLLVRMCPGESGELIPLPYLGALAEQAATSASSAFIYGALLGAIPLALALFVIRLRRPTLGAGLKTAGIYFVALAPALYLASSYLALLGLLAMLGGAAVGALAPAMAEVLVRRSLPSRGNA